MPDLQLIFIIVILAAGVLFAFKLILASQIKTLKDQSEGEETKVLMEWLKDMKGSVEKNSDVLERQLKSQTDTLTGQLKSQRHELFEQTKQMWKKLDESREVIGRVQKELGGLQEFSKDMKDLSNVLKSPKLRGGLGEQMLYEILTNYLPVDLFKTQYKFKSGDTCDAVIFTDKGMIPIDSKFPLENFKLMLTHDNELEREKAKKVFIGDVKKRIDEIATKYILPSEGTTDQAVMYIPSENVYYELVVNTPQIDEYSKQKNVVLASPNTIAYFLKVILVAYQQHELEKHAGEILKSLSGIKMEARKFGDDLGVLDRHISNAYKAMESVGSKYQKLFGRIESVQVLESPLAERAAHVDAQTAPTAPAIEQKQPRLIE